MAKTGIGWWDNAVESVYNMYNDFKKNLPDNNAQTSNNETKVQTQSAAPKAASSGTRPENTVGIRKTLNDMGFKNSNIGYNSADGTVMLYGKKFMKPQYIDEENGISYSPLSDIQRSLVEYYAGSSNPIVRVSDAYAAEAGDAGLTADGLSFGNGTVMIGGVPLDTLYIDDSGKAWAWQDDVKRLTSDYKNRVGAKSPNNVFDRVNDKYLTQIEDSINALRNREEFSYDPDSDPVYNAYKQKYLTEGARASRNAMADYSALTGGYANSAAVTASSMANQYYAKQLSDQIPALAESAYKRYSDKYQTDLDTIEQMLDMYNSAYNNAMSANNQTTDNINTAAKSAVSRDNAAYKRNREAEKTAFSNYWDNLLNQQKLDTQGKENEWNELFNNQKYEANGYINEGYRLKNRSAELDNSKNEKYLDVYDMILKYGLENSLLDNNMLRAELRAKYGYYY